MKAGLTISAIAHAGVLAWGLISFSSKPLPAVPTESMPIDIISSTELSQLQAGARNAPKTQTPKPLVEKVAEAKPVEDPNVKVSEKPEILATSPTPPPPEPKVPEPKPAPPVPQE